MAAPIFWLTSVGLCLGCGILVGTEDVALSVAVSGGVVIGGVVWSRAERIAAGEALVGLAFLIGGTVDLLGQFKIGSYSGLAVVTLSLTICLGLTAILPPTVRSVSLPRCTWWLFAFAGFSTASIVWAPLTTAGIQNILVYDSFVGIVWVAGRSAHSINEAWRLASDGFLLLTLVSSALYLASLVIGGPGTGAVVGSRSYGLVGMLSIAWLSAGRMRRRDRGLAVMVLVLIAASLSRLALAVSATILCLSRLSRKGRHRRLDLF